MNRTQACRQTVRRPIVASTVVLCLLAPAAACAAGTLTACMPDAPEGMDVVQFETSATINAVGMTIFDPLLRMAPGSTEIRPGLAQRWETSADGKTLTLHLRRGVKFHNTAWFKPTRDLNADDVVASLERLRDKAHPWHGLSTGGYLYWQSMGLHKLVLETAKIDSHTVRIRLARPDASFASTLTMPAIGSIYPAEYVNGLIQQGQGSKLNVQPVGSGPYVFRSMSKGSLIRFDAHSAHWAGSPPVDKLIMAFVPDDAVSAQKLRVGECQFGELPRAEASQIEAVPSLQVLRHQPLVTTYLWINTTAAGLGDQGLRQALRLAIDRKAVVQAAYAGDALATDNLLPPTLRVPPNSSRPVVQRRVSSRSSSPTRTTCAARPRCCRPTGRASASRCRSAPWTWPSCTAARRLANTTWRSPPGPATTAMPTISSARS
jgi:dipeptide transport system substrate-binding protein